MSGKGKYAPMQRSSHSTEAGIYPRDINTYICINTCPFFCLPLLPLFPLLPLLQLYWPSCCFLFKSSSFLPQGLCTCCSPAYDAFPKVHAELAPSHPPDLSSNVMPSQRPLLKPPLLKSPPTTNFIFFLYLSYLKFSELCSPIFTVCYFL